MVEWLDDLDVVDVNNLGHRSECSCIFCIVKELVVLSDKENAIDKAKAGCEFGKGTSLFCATLS